MASNDHTDVSGSPSLASMLGKDIMIDIEGEPSEYPNTTKCSIYRVPCSLWDLNKDNVCYTPQLVSIGPFHYGQDKLKRMQKQKLRYLNLFWDRVENDTEAKKVKFKRFLEEKEETIRLCYAEKLSYNKEKLVGMMLLDSVFIMELFLRIQRQKEERNDDELINQERNDDELIKQTDSDDIILKQSWLNKSIQRDLLLLENQIPLFILEELYNTVVPEADKERQTFIELAHDYFECFHAYKKDDSCSAEETGSSDFNHKPSKNCNDSGSGFQKRSSSRFKQLQENWKEEKKEPQHFTDLIRYFYLYKDLKKREKGSPCNVLRTATNLRESGVSFEKVLNKDLLDIKFVKDRILSWFLCLGCLPKFTYFKARLQIPQLKIRDPTECVLRNLIAFEQCHYPNEPYICNYVSFIDSLIHTKDDVELLVEKEVIVHELGSDKEVATLVNSLCKHVVADNTCYLETINHLNKHYQRQWNRTMAALRLVYFRDAWRASSTLVATAVLVFTIFNFWRVLRLVLDLEGGYRSP